MASPAPLAKKLLLKPGMKVALVGAPADQRGLFGDIELVADHADAVVLYAPIVSLDDTCSGMMFRKA